MRQLNLFDQKAEERKRDEALDELEEHRADLISRAAQIAREIATESGTVTSSAVLAVLRRECPQSMTGIDCRFMGAVFRRGRGWLRLGWSPEGSHSRPVSVWKLADESA